jgi:transposase
METLLMNQKERRRLAVLSQVKGGRLSLRAAAELLDLSERQAWRVLARYRRKGDAGLVHGLRGRPGNRRCDASLRERAAALYRKHYGDFKPKLASEYLMEEHGLAVERRTLRRWLVQEGLWQGRGPRGPKRKRRERRACLGELVQIDGSEHDWFEGRGSRCVLMVMIDDATGLTLARFYEAETTRAAMGMVRAWATGHGLPLALYSDRHSIYRVNTQSADQEHHRTGKRPRTQMGRALAELGVDLIWANSPQAKGRVERANGTLQDRLVKALRVRGIDGIEAANRFLDGRFLADHNRRFVVEAREPADLHRPVDPRSLGAALCVREARVAGRDQCVNWEGRALQLLPTRAQTGLAGRRVEVCVDLERVVSVQRGGQVIAHKVLAVRPPKAQRPALVERLAKHQPPAKPAGNHPWRAPALGPGRGRPPVEGRSAAAR